MTPLPLPLALLLGLALVPAAADAASSRSTCYGCGTGYGSSQSRPPARAQDDARPLLRKPGSGDDGQGLDWTGSGRRRPYPGGAGTTKPR